MKRTDPGYADWMRMIARRGGAATAAKPGFLAEIAPLGGRSTAGKKRESAKKKAARKAKAEPAKPNLLFASLDAIIADMEAPRE